jgi:hypothetical protein
MIGDSRTASSDELSIMPSLRRFSALLSGLLFLQLTLLGDGGACRVHGSARGGAGMAAMQTASAQHDGASSSHDACGAERAAKSCASMPSCATALGAPVSVVAHVQTVPAAQALPEPVSIHSLAAVGPDVPPPRG